MSMLKLVRASLIVCIALPLGVETVFSQSIRESRQVARTLHKIRYYDEGCFLGQMPDKNYLRLENMGLEAIPALLKEVTVEDIRSKVGPNGYILVASCLIQRITDKIEPLDWGKAYAARGEMGGLLTTAQRYQFQEEIMRQLDEKSILKCKRSNNELTCDRK